MSIDASVEDHVAVVEVRRGPNNYFDEDSLRELAGVLTDLDASSDVRAIVLCSQGKHFCAGANLRGMVGDDIRRVYRHAFTLFTIRRPIIAAVQGAAIGGGLGLALATDFRVATPTSRFSANFARLGFHHGFGLSVTLPAVVGNQRALDLLYTGRSVSGVQAQEIGLCDRLTDGDVRAAAVEYAQEIAASAPLSVTAIRATMRNRFAADVHAALAAEADAQSGLLGTADFTEGLAAVAARRPPVFTGA